MTIRQRKRSSDSVLKSLTVLASHMRAATYILILVTTLFVTLAPSMVWFLYEIISHMAQKDIQPNNDVNMTMILTCLNTALQSRECNMSINIENINGYDLTETIRKVFHFQEASVLGDIIGLDLVLINSMFNPVIYALWYPDFRNYLVQISLWRKSKTQISDKYQH